MKIKQKSFRVKTVLTTAIFALLLTTSCKKEGCLDSEASNFDSEAKKDDGSCTFSGNVVFWIGESESVELVSSGVSDLNVYVDDVKVGDQGANVFWASSPACFDPTVVTKKIDLGILKSKSINYSIIDEDSTVHYTGIVTVVPGCTSVEMK